jgi:hypothetical protein
LMWSQQSDDAARIGAAVIRVSRSSHGVYQCLCARRREPEVTVDTGCHSRTHGRPRAERHILLSHLLSRGDNRKHCRASSASVVQATRRDAPNLTDKVDQPPNEPDVYVELKRDVGAYVHCGFANLS